MYRSKVSKKQKKSGFEQTLVNPFNLSVSSRIPDFCAYETTTFTDSKEFTFGVSAAGEGGCVIGVFPGNAAIYVEDTATTTSASYAYVAGFNLTGYSNYDTNYQAARCTGFGVKYEFIGNDNNNEGLAIANFIPSGAWVFDGGDSQGNTTGQINFNAGLQQYGFGKNGSNTVAENAPYNKSFPAKDGCMMTWVPFDPRDLEYGDVSLANKDTWVTGAALLSPTLMCGGVTSLEWAVKGGFGLHVTGANASAKFRVTVQAHYEGIPKTQTGLAGEMAVNDPVELATALNVANRQERVSVLRNVDLNATGATGERTVLTRSVINSPPVRDVGVRERSYVTPARQSLYKHTISPAVQRMAKRVNEAARIRNLTRSMKMMSARSR